MELVIDEVSCDEKLKQRKRGVKLTVVVLLSFITLIMFGFINKITSPRILTPIELQINGARVFERPRELSAFNLATHEGKKFTLQSLQGQWSLMFFGFSQCPDICPTTLAMLNQWYQTLDRDIQMSTQVAMVSLDPARDSQGLLAQYVPYFNSNFIGVRGDFIATKRFANQLNVAFNKIVQDDNYSIDHSAHIALIDPLGNYYGYFKPPFDPARLKLTYLSIRATY